MNLTVGIIIPIYNAEKNLRRCIESVLKQEYTNFKLILVDDGSSDSSGAICDEYREKEHHCDMVISDFYRVVGERVSHKGDILEEGVLSRVEFASYMKEKSGGEKGKGFGAYYGDCAFTDDRNHFEGFGREK